MASTFTRTATFDLTERKASREGRTSFPATISTETGVTRTDPWTGKRFTEILSHAKDAIDLSRAPLPLIESHDRSKVNVGIVENLRIDGTRLRGDVVLGKSQRAQELAADIEAGIVTGLSVGYQITADDFDESAKRQLVTKWTVFEVSIVSVPADQNAGIGRSMNMEVVDPNKAANDVLASERERVQGIRLSVRSAKLSDEFATKLINGNVPLDQARQAVINAMAERSDANNTQTNISMDDYSTRGGSGISLVSAAEDKFLAGASAWMYERTGMTAMLRKAKERRLPGFENIELDPGEFRGSSFLDVARESLERRGKRTRGMGRLELAGRAMTERSGGYASASDFSVLLENAMGKVLLGAYATAPDTWKKFCKTETVQDFRESGRYRAGSFGALDVLPENAEYQNKAIPDGAKTSISTETRGNMISLSRQAIINDDMGALMNTVHNFGRAAALSIETAVYALLAQNAGLGPTMSDSNPFFHSSRGNVNATGSTLTVAGLDADRVVLAAQRDISDNDYLDLRPSVLLVASTLGGEARVLNKAQYDPLDNKFMKPNKVVGLFQEVIDTARLSGTRRYLFTDPGVAAAIVVAFLEGAGESPYMEQQQGWRVDGTSWKLRIDFKAQMFDPKAAVTNAGT